MTDAEILIEKVLEHALFFGVPLFLMVTGALLLQSERAFTAKRLICYLKRIITALLLFSFLFLLLQNIFEDGFSKNIFAQWIDIVINGKSWAHMWYLYLMIALYLLLPVLRVLTSKVSKNTLLIIITVLVVFSTIFSIIYDYGFTLYAINVHLSNVIYPTYLLLGYYFYNNKLQLISSIIIFTGSTIAIIAGTIITDDFSALCSYSSILIVAQALGLFSILINLKTEATEWVKDIDRCTFGIYLIHMIGVRAVMKWAGFNPYDYGFVCIILISIVLFFASYLVTKIMKKILKIIWATCTLNGKKGMSMLQN